MSDSVFPDARWGSTGSPLAKAATAFAKTSIGSKTVKALEPLDRAVLQRTNGRYTVLGPIGAPILLLETTGNKSGLTRTHPLLFARDDEAIYVAGSNFGGESHPAWSNNLLATPRAVVLIRGKRIPVQAELLDGQYRENAYRKLIDVVDVYATYRKRTDRPIRVFRLTAQAT